MGVCSHRMVFKTIKKGIYYGNTWNENRESL